VWLVTGIVAAVAVVGYMLVAFRGSYFERQGRQASLVAVWLRIEDFAKRNFFKAVEWFNEVGNKINRKMMGNTWADKFRDWMDDHVNSPFVKALKSIGRTFKNAVKGIGWVIIGLPYGLWKAIQNAKGRNVFWASLVGFVLILVTVVKFFSADYYPLRAIFFIDLGFGLFIGSFAILILHLIYEIFYK
jgi:hypothetical protein